MKSDLSIATHALVFSAHKNNLQSSDAIAKNICTNSVTIRRILSKLKSAGFVDTKEGNDGGYFFVGNAKEISLKDVANAIEFDAVKSFWMTKDPDVTCKVSMGMNGVMDDIYTQMNQQCLTFLETISIYDIINKLF